jgi:hypothetical protein
MLARSIIAEVDRLLQEGKLSHRRIALRTGVSRGTVSAIASGRRGLHGKEADSERPNPLSPLGPPLRCPGCGFLVYMPCLVCRARASRHAQRMLGAALSRRAERAGRARPNSRIGTGSGGPLCRRARVA